MAAGGAPVTPVSPTGLYTAPPAGTQLPATLGRKASSASLAVVQAALPYEKVAAGQTDQPLGTTSAIGDYLSHVVIYPTALTASCIVKDGAVELGRLTAGTLADLSPKTIPFGVNSLGLLTVTTVDCTLLAVGNFT
jgi:hypothetical protein